MNRYEGKQYIYKLVNDLEILYNFYLLNKINIPEVLESIQSQILLVFKNYLKLIKKITVLKNYNTYHFDIKLEDNKIHINITTQKLPGSEINEYSFKINLTTPLRIIRTENYIFQTLSDNFPTIMYNDLPFRIINITEDDYLVGKLTYPSPLKRCLNISKDIKLHNVINVDVLKNILNNSLNIYGPEV